MTKTTEATPQNVQSDATPQNIDLAILDEVVGGRAWGYGPGGQFWQNDGGSGSGFLKWSQGQPG